MVSLHGLAAVLFAFSFAVSTMAAPFLPEPVFLFNLTQEEFLLKRAEYKITKRDFVGKETKNQGKYMKGQRILEGLSGICVSRFGSGQRCYFGRCATPSAIKQIARIEFRCNVPSEDFPTNGNHHATMSCGRKQSCEVTPAYNYVGHLKSFPYCKDTLEIDKRPGLEVEVPPRYEGQTSLPNPEEAWQMSDDLPSPGTLDTYYHMADQIAGHQASWEYRGHWKTGWGFLTGSKGMASSFSCLGCPRGILYAETVGSKGKAEGFTLPHVPSPWGL